MVGSPVFRPAEADVLGVEAEVQRRRQVSVRRCHASVSCMVNGWTRKRGIGDPTLTLCVPAHPKRLVCLSNLQLCDKRCNTYTKCDRNHPSRGHMLEIESRRGNAHGSKQVGSLHVHAFQLPKLLCLSELIVVRTAEILRTCQSRLSRVMRCCGG